MPRTKTKKTAQIEVSENQVMSELDQSIWAAITKNGCSVCNVTYSEAEHFSTSLLDSSATIVTTEAARRLCSVEQCSPNAS